MHQIPFSSKRKPNNVDEGIDGYNTIVRLKTTIKSLGVLLDHHLTFGMNIAVSCAEARINGSMIARTCKKEGASSNALHHLINTATLPTLLWGAEVWWTGAAHVICKLGPT